MPPGLLLIVLAFVFLWFVLVRPQKRKQMQQRQMLETLKPGDQVVTAGGIYGEVTGSGDGESVLVRIAPALEVRVARRAIGAVVPAEIEDAEAEELEEHDEPEEPAAAAAGDRGETEAAEPPVAQDRG